MIRTPRSRGHRTLLAAGAVTALALLVAGCAGDAPAVVGQAPSSDAASAPPQPPELATVPAPGPPLGDTSSLQGRTVYWIPITSVAPVFTIEGTAAAEAFESVGMDLQVCDGQATPDAVGRCVGQAIAADAAGIIATSIPPEFSRQAFGDAVEAGIPTLFVNTLDDSTPPEWGELAAALPNNWADQAALNIDLLVEDSGGDAEVLVVGVTDSSTTVDFFENGIVGQLEAACPDCAISTVPTGSTSINQLSSLVSSALVSQPGTEYVIVQYDSFAAPVVQALRQQNRQGEVKLLTHLGQLDGLQRVADGDQWADTGYSLSVLGWNSADVLLRMMLGQDPLVDAHLTPVKTFTAANVGEVDLSQEGWQSGQWQTEEDFRAMYRELWGVQG
ncbi:MAG: hypothetical protein AVDCRST_MAG35-3028 [uncultured Quadrisphaera sp.]|uniref:Periplasmic binding protein domain-containing protein n=1 Tax=uncultured Quadrisphaera sp. TaxID=904978 RepID=A0A6J4QB60_9ACTN|nr:MAG: hypothetical protein AVDCRST_MAG35-3028 [uncultured Quadrisphaera sp.]